MTNKTDTEQLRAEFEAWAQNSFELHRHSAGEYSSNFTQTAWAAWQAGRAALQSQDREDAQDPFQPAANWLVNDCGVDSAVELAGRLSLGYNRSQRLIDHARRVEGEGE